MTVNRERAEKAARRLLGTFPKSELPVPVRAIARAAGCDVKFTPLDDDLSGMAFIKDGMRAIVVNASHHPNRQRFTIAHELAHHQLHIPLLQQGVHVDKAIFRRDQHASSGTKDFEIEANHFAAELLMPKAFVKGLVRPDFDFQDDTQLEKLANLFAVSTAAIGYRIQNIFSI